MLEPHLQSQASGFFNCFIIHNTMYCGGKRKETVVRRMSPSMDSHVPNRRPNADDLKGLQTLINDKQSFAIDAVRDAVVNLQSSGVSVEKIVEVVAEANCPLELILCMEDAQLNRALFECKKWKQMSPEQRSQLVAYAMSSNYLGCSKVFGQYGRGATKKKTTFLKTLEGMLDGPNADLSSAKWFVHQLANGNLVDRRVLSILQRIFDSGSEEAVRLLLDCGIDVYVKNKFGHDLKPHLFGNRNFKVNDLLQTGRFDLNARGKAGLGALHFAAKKNLLNNVELLLEAGADPNFKDADGEAPLFVAQSEKCMALLLEYGADIVATCHYDYTLFDVLLDTPKDVLIAHLVLLEAKGTPIKGEIRNSIFGDAGLQDTYEKYTAEVQWMKMQYVRRSFTLFAVLVEKIEVTARHVRDKDMASRLMDSCQKQQLYWYYTSRLVKNFNKTFLMRKLKCEAARVIAENIVAFDYNNIITEKIVDLLTFKDLQLFAS